MEAVKYIFKKAEPKIEMGAMSMKIPRIYIDTSVIGGCFDDEFNVWSNALFNDLRKGLFKPRL